jgi:nitroreductase
VLLAPDFPGNLAAMPEQPTDRLAQTSVPVHPPIAQRWSPRAFDADHEITAEQVTALLDAARWAATWGGRQPVRFVVGVRGDATYGTLSDVLSRGNAYATVAGALILVCADEGDDTSTALYSAVDAGAAEANLITEAVSRGLIAHPMAGFDADAARAAFAIPEQVRPLMVIAIGALADYATVSPDIAERDSKPRSRRPLDEVAFSTTWGQPWTGQADEPPGRPEAS